MASEKCGIRPEGDGQSCHFQSVVSSSQRYLPRLLYFAVWFDICRGASFLVLSVSSQSSVIHTPALG